MSEKTLLRDHLGPSIAKALATVVFQVPVITNPLVDFLKERLKGQDEAKQAERQIGRLVDQCLAPLMPKFASAKDVNAEAVAIALGETVEQHVDIKALVASDLDRARVHEMVMTKRPLSDLRGKAYATADIELYRRALPLLLDRLIDVAAKLEGFEGESTAEVLGRLTRLAQDAGKIRRSTEKIERWIDRQEAPWQDYASKYCTFIEEELDVVQLFGIKADASVKRQRLSTAFIPLSLNQASDDEDSKGSSYFKSLMNRLSPKQPRLLITGPAGSGKTTLMRWAAIEAAAALSGDGVDADILKRRHLTILDDLDAGAKWAESIGHAWQLRMPFLIPLRACKNGQLPEKDAYPAIATKYERDPPKGWVQSALDDGQALILIDGIDEVRHKDREEIRDQLRSLCRSFEGNYLVFTTRPGVVDDAWFADLDMMQAEVNPLAERERTELIKHWHKAAADDIGADVAKTSMAGLIEQLRTAPDIAQLGASPLLCAAICVYHYMSDGDLPEKQTELCDELCKLLIHRRDFVRKAPETQDRTAFGLLNYDHKALLIRLLAQKALRNGESALAPDVVDGLIAEKLPGFRLPETLDPSFVRERLVERSGVLREAYGGGVDFEHNTLRDFLAGQAFAAEPGGLGELAKNVGDQAWHRPIIFAASDRQHDVAEKLVKALIRKGTRIAKIIAILCDASVTYLDPELRDRVTKLRDDVFPPKTTDEAALLATLGDPIVDRLVKRGRSKTIFHACARALRLIGTEKAKEALRTYWQTEQQDIAEELAQIFNPLAVPFWQEWTKKELKFPDGARPSISDLAPLRGLTGLQALDLDNTAVADLAPLSGLTGLQALDLDNTAVADLAPLSGLTGLQVLYLNNTAVADLTPLSGLTGLQVLSLANTAVADLAPLSGLTGLQVLDLDNTAVADLAPLSGLTGLQVLYLNNTAVADLAPLSGLTGLQVLDLDNTAVADLAPLSGLTGLQLLYLNNTAVADLAPLSGLTGLQLLYLANTAVADLAPLSGLTRLQKLWLQNTQVADLAPLQGLAGLQVLSLNNTQVADLAPLQGLAGLQQLWLNNTQVADLAPLQGLAGLQRLWLNNTQVADVSVLDHIEGLKIMR